MIGAEVFIEPGQPQELVDTLFKRLKENGLTITRIRLFESYMHRNDGTWDFSLFDKAFRAGERYGIKIYGNLFPATPFEDVGGFKFPSSERQLKDIEEYIKNTVLHFKQFLSLYGWVPINEPGGDGIENNAFAKQMMLKWKEDIKISQSDNIGYPHLNFDKENFLLYYNTWYLKWLIDKIHFFDPGRPIHVNNHQIFKNVSQYNFSDWQKLLTSLGGSAHASWHFDYFSRENYNLAMSANSEIIRSGAGKLPWLMTELQGGTNIYSGKDPLCPTPDEITQWYWLTVGAGSKGAIYWCLNPRASGAEAGEWGVLDYQNHATDRLLAMHNIANCLQQNSTLLSNAKCVKSTIHVVYIRESMWVEERLLSSQKDDGIQAREQGAVMKSAIGYFEALSKMGLQPSFGELGELDFNKTDFSNETIILANQIAIPLKYWSVLEKFVANGGTLIADGLTAFFDENAICRMVNDFPLKNLFGGSIAEYKYVGNLFNQVVAGDTLPVHALKGWILPVTAKPEGWEDDHVIATRNNYGKGKVIWIPSMVGLGARISNDYNPLIRFLQKTLFLSNEIHFSETKKDLVMKTLVSDGDTITILTSSANENTDVSIVGLKNKDAQILFSNHNGSIRDKTVFLHPHETIVIVWKNNNN